MATIILYIIITDVYKLGVLLLNEGQSKQEMFVKHYAL